MEVRDMIGKEVEVIANGMAYRGILVEVSDLEVHLKGPMQWIALPVAGVGQIKPVEVGKPFSEEETVEAREISDDDIISEPSES